MIRPLDSFRPPREQIVLNEHRASMRSSLIVGLTAGALGLALQFNGHAVSSVWSAAVAAAALAVSYIDLRRVLRLDRVLQLQAFARFDAQIAGLPSAALEAASRDSRHDPETRNRLRLHVERRRREAGQLAHEFVAAVGAATVQPEPLKQAA